MVYRDNNKLHLILNQDNLFLWVEGINITYEPHEVDKVVEKEWKWFLEKAKEIITQRDKTPLSISLPEDMLFPDKVLVVKNVVLENWADMFWLFNLIIYPRVVKERNSTILLSPIETSVDNIIKPASVDDLLFQIYIDKIEWSRKELFKVIGQNYQASRLPMTEAEEILYTAMLKRGLNPIPQFSIKNEKDNLRFDYRVDFAFEKEHVYIECDDESHWKDEKTIAKDRLRTSVLSNFGWQGIRFTNYQIKSNPDECVNKICDFLKTRELSQKALSFTTNEKEVQELDESQRKAATHIDGPAVVIAGPGTGKTKTLVKRVEYLINNGIEPDSIVIITFSNKAATELNGRLKNILKDKSNKLNISTIHSFCLKKIIKPYYLLYRQEKFDLKITDMDKDLMPIFYGLKKYGLKKKVKVNIDYKEAKQFISNLKRMFIKPDKFQQLLENPEEMKSILDKNERMFTKEELNFIAELYSRYEDLKIATKKIDFDDMVMRAYDILKNNPIFRRSIQQRYQYILVDEYQDTGYYLHLLIQALAAPQDNLFVIGDDDQSIYGFRGAEPDVLLNFDKDYPNFSLYVLNTNYRSKADIVKYANRVITANTNRYHAKNIKPFKQDFGKILLKSFDNEILEAISIADTIKALIKEKNKTPSKEKPPFAVLTRSHNSAIHITEELIKRGISITDTLTKMENDLMPASSIDMFYNKEGVQEIISYMKIAVYGYSKQCEKEWVGKKEGGFNSGYEGILNVPNRYIDKKEFTTLLHAGKNFFNDFNLFTEHFKHRKKQLEDLKKGIDSVRSAINRQIKLSKIVELIRNIFDLDTYFLRHDYFGNKDESIIEDMNIFQINVDRFIEPLELFSFIEDFPKKIAKNRELEPYVFINTIHSSKGLEFDIVFLPTLNDGILPHKKNKDIEEERRLFYVGITRAEEELYISYTESIGGKAANLSPFLVKPQ
ncbi:MAG: UvrD-helicase domain-containing protein [Thermodesulfovibrionales bacterium]